MAPSSFVFLERLPLTPSGKVDRAALPEPGAVRPELGGSYVEPRTGLERRLAGLWGRVLGVGGVGAHDNFFELGGDSIRGAVLINKLQEEINEEVRVVALFDAPTVAELAAYLSANFPEDVFRVCGAAYTDVAADATARVSSEQPGGLSAERILEVRKAIRPLAPRPPSAAPRNPSAVFVLSPPRSGSTLLRVMLGGHPELFAPPELELLSFHTLAERRAALSGRYSFWQEGTLRALMQVKGCTAEEAKALMGEYEERRMSTREFYRRLQEWIPGRRLVDKTPSYALDERVLRSAEEHFENALYVRLVRHPQAMIRSFVEAHLEQVFFRYEHELDARELAEALWVISHENIGKFLSGVPAGRQHTVRFEELVKAPEQVIGRLCDFLGIEPVGAMLEPYKGTGERMTDGIHPLSKMLGDVKFHEHQGIEPEVADRWKQDGQARLGDLTWRLAESLGYQREDRPRPKPSPSQKTPSHFAAIQPRGGQPPLYCVHAAGGHVYSYANLSRCLGEGQPFYGIQSPGLFEERGPFETIREMAAYYVENLLAFQPRGPYLLAGHSTGGQVAFEMAQALSERGRRVALLALFDTDAVSTSEEARSREEMRKQDDATILAEMLRHNLPLSPEHVRRLKPEERLPYIIGLAQEHNLIPPDFRAAQAGRFLRTLRANIEASARYVPEKYEGRVTLFRAAERVTPSIPHGETLGWGGLAALEVHFVPGNHLTMLGPPHVEVVAELLKTCLRKARRGE
jgi:thioesterase domain-containing protein